MNNICKIFRECSSDILNWLTKQPEVKEESMTDRFLFDISERLPIVKYKQFSRMEEGRKTGADWEWWFLFPNDNSFCARVQAKKLKNDEDNYAGIAYTKNGTLQIERLIEDSDKDNFASMYVFYSSENSQYTLCEGLKKGLKVGNEGVFIGDAVQLKDEIISKPRAKYLARDILKYTNPISCLFCCPMAKELSYGGLKEYFKKYFPKNIDTDNNQKGFVETPRRISQFMNKESDTWWEKEYRYYIENVNAILVIDLRNKSKMSDNK